MPVSQRIALILLESARTTRLRRPRNVTLVSRDISVHRIPPHVRDDREPPLLSGETGELVALICPSGLSGIFFVRGLDRFLLICPTGLGKNSDFSRVDVRFCL
jgi:hypothetical protein